MRHRGDAGADAPTLAVIIAAAGSGVRMGGVDKALLPIAGRSVLQHSLDVLARCHQVAEVVIVGRQELSDAYQHYAAEYPFPVQVVSGGANRIESVMQGLLAVSPDTRWVAIHDGARPLLSQTLFDRLFLSVQEHLAVVPGLPLIDTVKEIDKDNHTVVRTVDRRSLRRIQTPQMFSYPLIRRAYEEVIKTCCPDQLTDDASVLEQGNHPVLVVPGDDDNIKITRWDDVRRVESILQSRTRSDAYSVRPPRIGIGYDVHPLVAGRRLMLGGVCIPSDRGLSGHSDADVLLHAICDALLGAAALGDIGVHFPPGDDRWKDIDSLHLLRQTAGILADRRWRPSNVDATVIAEQPKLLPHIPLMRRNIAQVMRLDESAVSIKATTHEGLGSLGRGEGIAALSVCQIVATPLTPAHPVGLE